MGYAKNLFEAIVGHSVADNLKDAMKEWEPYGIYEDKKKLSSCICGKTGIRFRHSIRNVYTGCVIEPVGSVCISKFKGVNDKLVNECSAKEDALRAKAALESCGSDVPLIKAPMFTRQLVMMLGRFGVFGDDPTFARLQTERALHIFNKRKPLTHSERNLNDWLMRDFIVGWLKRQ